MQLLQRQDPGGLLSGLLAVTVHVLLAMVLFLGVRWKTRQPDPIMAELWSALPPIEAPRVEAPKPEPKPEPKPAPKPEPKVEPKVEAKAKADIALAEERKKKEKAEQERKQKAEQERKRREEERRAKEEKERKEREAAAEAQRQEEERVRVAAETRDRMQEQLNRELGAAAKTPGPPSLGDPKARAQWADRIRAVIRRNIVLSSEIPGNPEAVFDVQLDPSGYVLDAKLRKSSGVKAYDDAVERAILKSSPLPLPERREVFEPRLELHFRPKE